MLWLRTILFTVLVPGTVLGLVPFALTASTKGQRIDLGTAHLIGFTLLLPGVAIIIWCFIDFIRRGRGTPAPYDPPRKFSCCWPLYVCEESSICGRYSCRCE